MYLYINKIVENTKIEGPGSRYCIYVQGCSIQCKDCISPQTWSSETSEKQLVEDIIQNILESKEKNNIEGVTFSGGEPFDQSKSLVKIAREIKEEKLSIVIFTGYTIENIFKSLDKHSLNLLECTDLLIDGPFLKDKRIYNKPWIGSSNQKYHFLTNRYNQKGIELNSNKIEITLDKNGEITVCGIINNENIEKLLDNI